MIAHSDAGMVECEVPVWVWSGYLVANLHTRIVPAQWVSYDLGMVVYMLHHVQHSMFLYLFMLCGCFFYNINFF